MKRTTLLSLIIGLSFLNTAFSQTAVSSPKTLLWRISGHGLKNNSFLYGTMHVQDKRLFFFGDSLYHCLEQADGYAMEVDLHEVVDSMVQRMIEQKEQEMFNKGFSMGKNKTKTIDSLLKNVEKFNDKASRKQLIKLREERMNSVFKNKEMPTIMDAYLYYIAQRQGKWVGAVEDVQDQLPLLDELGKDIGREELLAPEKEMEVSAEKMIRIYLSQDLDKLEEYTVESIRGEAVDKMLLKRNRKMAERMDSMSHSRSMFFAVGAAHLPGDSGVISLLRKKGYSVTPVFSVQKVDPDKYASKLAGIPWVKVAGYDKTYSVEMPGKPSDMSLYNDMLKMQYYVDMATMNFFMTASSIVQKDVSLDKVVENMSTNSDANILSKKAITSHGLRGMETSFTTSGYYYKVQFLVSGKTMYML
ncbi:MAG TPA: TraB/GumN family protein, partial [Chitinophagaceae bacterium]|nr:TraB/GumN family protein [Chitinophagaceae bacterium]